MTKYIIFQPKKKKKYIFLFLARILWYIAVNGFGKKYEKKIIES
jgi:hypothetical protein